MTRHFYTAALTLAVCLATSFAQGEPRGRGGEKAKGGNQAQRKPQAKPGGAQGGAMKSPGGNWSQRSHAGKSPSGQANHAGAAAGAAGKNKNGQASGEHGAAAGAAAANRKSPQASGAQGAAAGAAASNRNSPQASGAQGAAAGAAAANRRSPQASGAEGAAAGAAAANRRGPQVSGAAGAAAGAAAADRREPEIAGAGGAALGYAGVRNSFNHPNIYGAGWYGDHPGAWAATGWGAGAAWVPSTWAAVAGNCGYAAEAPISYNYGENVVAQDGNVMVNGQNVGTTEEYSQQAADLAASGSTAEAAATDEWLPLGVFAMVRDEKQHPHLILQMAINKQGILRGNYTDEVSESTQPIHGAVDKQTQRAAWTVGDNTQSVMEAGINDLTQGEAPALIHKNGKTDHWLLVRLEQPQQDGGDAGK